MILRRYSLLLPLVFGSLLSGCTSNYLVRPGTLEPGRATVAPDQRAAVWRRAVGVLLDQGYVPQVLNEDAGFINAKRREDIANDAFSGTIALVYISPEGSVRVEVSGSGLFHSENQFLAAVGQRQQMLLNLILGRGGEDAHHG
jgi:hypothetical protein